MSKFETAGGKKSTEKTPMLEQFGTDLTRLASQGKLEPVIGRAKETRRCCQILARKKKNNPILIGDPGVGKTIIAHGIAQMIANKTCPINLFGKRVISIEMGRLVAGTVYRGQFEERMIDIIKEIKAAGNVIVFIDEAHTIIGAGSGSGTLDTSNIMKPALSDGTLQIIGATTLDEYKKHFETDGALTRRFQTVLVEPTTVDDTIQILNEIKGVYETHHSVQYTKEAVESCVKLSDRYITDKVLPDKAIDLLDEAGATANLVTVSDNSNKIQEFEEELKRLVEKKAEYLEVQNYEMATVIRNQQRDINAAIEAERERIHEAAKKKKKKVTPDMIEALVTQMTGIPIQKMNEKDLSALSGLGDEINAEVVGQEEAISKVTKAIKRARVGIKNPNKPISFMLIGTTGIGKTLLCKTVAKKLLGSEDAFVRIDMSEYMEKFNVSRLIGAPPGYVGYEEGGQLTEKIRRKPYLVVLLDEIEKAHPDVFDILLQILDDGHITDSLGRKINFKNVIIFMTSNIGAKKLQTYGTGVGFATASKQSHRKEEEHAVLIGELNKFFKPEFLNRIDDILQFNPLEKDKMMGILELELKKLKDRMKDLGYEVTFDKPVKEFLVEKGFDPKLGARPLNRAIQNHIEDLITDDIIDGKIVPGSSFKVTMKKEVPSIKINKIPSQDLATI